MSTGVSTARATVDGKEPALLSEAEVRSHFPALDRMHAGERVAYFDGPGGTQVPRAVGEAMTSYLYEHNANTYWEYPSSAETDAAILASRETLSLYTSPSPRDRTRSRMPSSA